MKKMTKRIVSLLLALVMVLGLAACGKTGGATTSQGDDEKVTLTIGLPLKANVSDYENNDFTNWIEETCNVNLEFMFFSGTAADAKTQILTMIAGGEKLPDIIYSVGLNNGERDVYGKDGYLLDLTPYFEDEKLTGPWKERLMDLFDQEYIDNTMRTITSPDGKIYCFPSCVISDSDQPYTMMYINQTWLDKLGLEMPRTWDQFVTVLRAFRDNDPNGNGLKDELPLVGANITRCRVDNWMMNNFERVHDFYRFNLDAETGKLWLPYISDNYREGLKAINSLVEEGLVSEISWSLTDQNEIKSIWTPASGVPIAGVIGAHMTSMMETNNPIMYDYEPLYPLEGSYAPRLTTVPSHVCYISGDTEYPDKCAEVLFAIASEEGSMAMRFGKEGEDWRWTKDYGTDNTAYELLTPDVMLGNTDSTWGVAGAFTLRYTLTGECHEATLNPPDQMTWGEIRVKKAYDYAEGYIAVTNATEPEGTPNWYTVYNEEETEELGNIQSEIHSYFKNATARFCVGELDPYDDKQWNEYVNTIKDMGIEKWEEIANRAYQRYMAG